ncbi:MAG: barstar family protein [Patescibacteria group bacterium]
MKKTYEIDGNNFNTLDGFYSEFESKVLDTPSWGRNLDAFNDVLSGGFGTPDEGFILVWDNSDKSRESLGWEETIKYIEHKLTTCHPSNVEDVQKELEDAKQGKGETIFKILIYVIKNNQDVELVLK